MTDNEYLNTLNLFEGNGDITGIATSPAYGITESGIEFVSRAIRKKENGTYTLSALNIQGMLDQKLCNTLLRNIKWEKGTMTKHASLKQIEPYGIQGYAELALAIRQINKDRVDAIGSWPLDEELKDRIALAAHNRPALLQNKDIREAIASSNEDAIRHEFLVNLDRVSKGNELGIRRRLACLFNTQWRSKSPADMWESFNNGDRNDLGMKLDDIYQKDEDYELKRLRQSSYDQSYASKFGSPKEYKETNAKPLPNENKLISDLFPNKMSDIGTLETANLPAPKKEDDHDVVKTGWDAFTSALRPFFEPLFGKSNQVADAQKNILNNSNGEQ